MSDIQMENPPMKTPDTHDRPPSQEENGSASSPLLEQAKQQAHRVVEQTQQKAGQAMGQARDKTKSWLDQQMNVAAGNLDEVAHAVRSTGSTLREQGMDSYSRYAELADGAAEAVEKASGYLREANVDQVVGEVEHFARRQPLLFLGIAAGLGFLAARFLKSTGQVATEANGYYNPDRYLPVVPSSQTGVGPDYGTGTTG